MAEKMIAIKSSRIITPLLDLRDAVVLIDGKNIAAIGRQKNIQIPDDCKTIDVGNKIIAPGFVDIHNHGGSGLRVAYDGRKAVEVNSLRLVETGCTTWLPTVKTEFGVREVVECIKSGLAGADVPGIHMEGPFLKPKSIETVDHIDYGLEKPSLQRFNQFVEEAQGFLKMMGVSIELEETNAIISEMRKLGIVAAVAHSTQATYEDFMRAVELGITHVTHTYNVMTALHHRKPGVVGGALTCEQVTNEIIADGFHVSPVAIDILLRCRGTDNVCIITDNTAVAGLPDGIHEIRERKLLKENGVTRFLQSNSEMDHTMAGSEWPMNHNVLVMIEKVGVKIPDAIKMASLVPAKIVRLDRTIGSIEPGKDADIIVVDDKMNVYLTFVKGELCYDRDNLVEKGS